MATRNPSRWGRQPRGGGPAPAPGAEPLGTVRRSQLISTYGIGGIVDLEKGSFMPMGLEDWEDATRLPSLTIAEARLQAQLGVSHFRLPPVAEPIAGTRQVNPRRAAPAVRFPKWQECPRCHRLGVEGDPFELAPDGARLVCVACGSNTVTNPVRFVVACRAGHVDEFPWVWWAHRRRKEGVCTRPILFLRSRGQSAALADLIVECQGCRTGKAYTSSTLGDAFGAGMHGRACPGVRPWLHDKESDCQQEPRVLQRGASNIHFPIVASALSIPPVSESLFQLVEDHWLTLEALPAEALEPVLANIAARYGVDTAPLRAAYDAKKEIDAGGSALSEASSRAEEYAALSATTHDPMLGGIVPHFRNNAVPPPAALAPWFDLVGAASRLREVRALAGFSRIEPYPVGPERVHAAIMQGRVAPLSKGAFPWLPAAEILGEGIFLRFRTERVDAWVHDNPAVGEAAAILDQRSARIAVDRGYIRDYSITPRLLLVHSFAHALIREISLDCGYSSSALRERLYVSEAVSGSPAMNGVLIYTGSPDSEGSLGGLVRLSEEALLARIVTQALRNARWCGSDPVCLETDRAQSGDRISGAACHCCLLLPETACEKFNRELDRTTMVGDGDRRWVGFFDGLGD